MERVNEEEYKEVLEKAREWFKNTDGRFADCRSVTISAVAEYIANQSGKTIFWYKY